jgi:glutathionylspermidine synthase
LWAMFPRHPNLLAAYFDDDSKASELGDSYVRKPIYSREGANVTMVVGGQAIDQDQGPYGAEGFVRQAVATLPKFQDNYAAIGSWLAGAKPCGLSVREELTPITKNTSRFLPHAIVG